MKVIRLLHFDFPAKLGGQNVCLMHEALSLSVGIKIQCNYILVFLFFMFHGTKNCNWVRNEFINKEHVKSEAKNYSIYR